MASKSLGTLTLDLVAKIGGFEAGLDKASRKAKTTSADISKYAKNIGIGIAAGVTAAAVAVAAMVAKQREVIDVQAKMAQRLKTTSESIAILNRAVDRSGLSFKIIETAGRTLDIALGKAAQGTVAQVDALKKLNLEVRDFDGLSLEKRFLLINKALRENVTESERAVVAADLLGSRGSAAIQQLQPDVIAAAAREVKIFGLNLSDVDAAKVEAANDAMSTFALLSKGIGQQLTVELSPILQEIGEEFVNSAEKAGGLGTAVADATRDAVEALSFVVSAVDGIDRAFELAANAIIVYFSKAFSFISQGADKALNIAKYIPATGIYNLITDDLDEAQVALRQFSGTQESVVKDAIDTINRLLEEPLKGDGLLAYYDKLQAKADALAKSGVAGRTGPPVDGGPTPEEIKAAEDAVKAAEKAAASLLKTFQTTEDGYEKQIALIGATTEAEKLRYEIAAGNLVGINEAQQDRLIALADELDAVEKLKQQQEDYTSLVKELRTDEEKLNDTLIARVAILKESGKLNSETAQRVVNDAFQAAPQFAGLAPEIGGAGGELRKVDAAQAELEAWYATQLEMLETYRKQEGSLNAEYDEKALALKKEHEKAIADIEYARQQASLVVTEELFGSLADAARAYAGEQSGIYKTLFAIEKAAAIARSIVAIQTGIAIASEGVFPANLAAMASVAAATASIIGNISAVSIGQAHDGIDSVPKSGTWNLEKGERVTTAKTSAKLDRTLSDVQSNMSGGGSSNIRIINAYDSGEVVGGYLGSKAGEKAIMNVVARNRRTIQSFAV